VKKALLSLALTLVAANAAFAQIATPGGTSLPVVPHGPYYLAEAYPATSSVRDTGIPCRGDAVFSDNASFCGGVQGADNTTAAPGILALQEVGTGQRRLDVNCFVTIPTGNIGPAYVQSYRLFKRIPGSQKCPETYRNQVYFQTGGQVRTWWSLIYTQPGTQFVLELTVRTLTPNFQPALHVDPWTWEVQATFDSLRDVIDVLHSNAIGTTEIPCIASQDMYNALKASVALIETPILATIPSRADAQDQLFNMEALIVSFCAFTDCFIADDVFSAYFPPTNDMQFGNAGFTGIIDTIENPCCCKLLADLESIALCYGIILP
jgi:hypothetical protein